MRIRKLFFVGLETCFPASSGAPIRKCPVWQKWIDGKLNTERYYDGDMMEALLKRDVLQKPDIVQV